ncbi:FIVAR domain-containing protein, partial [Intestinibacter sp.]|uniref:FIVAR domain-containing protein n=1 Tax=Intestinibacter sp. TaxID=1965304 RepID=UPI003F16556C
MYLRETIKKPISVMLTIMMVVAYMLPYQLSYAEEIAYGFQGVGGNTLKMLSYDGQITVEEQTSEKYVNSINTKIDGSEDIVFGVTMTAGMNAFGDGTNFKNNCMPYIKIYDSKWENVVAEYDGGNGKLKYISYDETTRNISIGVDKGVLEDGDYILVFGPEVCGNNVDKKIGVPIAFKFTVSTTSTTEIDKTALNNLIAEAEQFVSEAQIGTEVGQYPSKDAIETAISDAKTVSENDAATQDEVNQAVETLTQALAAFKETVVKEEVIDENGRVTITIVKGSTLEAATKDLLVDTGKTYSDLKDVKVIADDIFLTRADLTYLNENFTALEKLDLSE